jgi:hypothetical protein
MTAAKVPVRSAAVGATLLFLVVSSGQIGKTAHAQGTSGGVPGIVGTWFLSVPGGGPGSGLVGFITYDHSGTLTETVTSMFGGPPQPNVAGLNGTDRGVWRYAPQGFELLTFRMLFDSLTGEVIRIVRLRALVHFEGDRDHLSGTFLVTQWVCPTPTTCPDPTSAAPDVPEFAPPENTWTQSRVRFSQ